MRPLYEIWEYAFKRVLDKYNIIPNIPPPVGIYTILSVGMGNDGMPSFTFQIGLLLRKYRYS